MVLVVGYRVLLLKEYKVSIPKVNLRRTKSRKVNSGIRVINLSHYKVGFSKVLISFLLLISFSLPAVELLTLRGVPSQGSLIIGEVGISVNEILLDGKKITPVNQSFIIGFDRDAELKHNITLKTTDGRIENIFFYLNKYIYDIQYIEKVDKKYTQQPTNYKLQNRIYNESQQLKKIRNQMKNNIFSYVDSIFIRPVEKGWISSTFGGQRIINGISQQPHNGLDIALPLGIDIHAMTSGIVSLIGDYFYNGKFVLIDHGKGLSSIYLHMNDIYVMKGDYVKTGDMIGEVGSTGRSTGNHLHWGVSWNGKRINPELVLKTEEIFLTFKRDMKEVFSGE